MSSLQPVLRIRPRRSLKLCLLVLSLLFIPLSVRAGRDAGSLRPTALPPSHVPESQPAVVKPLAPAAATPIGGGPYDQTRPAVAFNSQAGEYLVVWEDVRSVPGPTDIFGRRVGLDGTPIGDRIPLVVENASESVPDVVYNPVDNEYLLVWQLDAADSDIYAQRLGGAGTPVGPGIPIAVTTYQETNPRVAWNAETDEYLVVWEHFTGGEFGQNDVYGQRVAANGSLLGDPILICTRPFMDSLPAVASGAGGWLVVWQAKQSNLEYDIYGQKVGNDGALVGGQLTISNASGDQLKPRLAYSPHNFSFLVVWEDHRWGSTTSWYIYGQRVDTNGLPVGGDMALSGAGSEIRLNPDVAYQPNVHQFAVAWEFEWPPNPADHDIYWLQVMEDGARPEPEMGLATTTAVQSRPALAADNATSYLTVWEDDRDAAAGEGINIYGDLARLYQLSGHVFAGNVGDESTPVAGALMYIFCSTSPDPGVLFLNTTTDGSGWYGFAVAGMCTYYDIVENDPPGYTSAGATSVGGAVINDNRIRYSSPLIGKTLTGNKFWDYAPSGITHCSSCSDCQAKLDGSYSLVYVDADLNVASGSCIQFNASNTALDCQGHTIQAGTATEFSYGIGMVGRGNNTIRNCSISGFESGLRLQSSSYIKLLTNTLSSNGTGAYLAGSDHNTLTANTMHQNQDGLYLNQSSNNALSNNVLCKNTHDIASPNATSGNTRSGDKCDTIYNWNWNGTTPQPPEWCDQTCTPNVATVCSSGQDCLSSLNGDFNYVSLSGDLAIAQGIPINGNHLTLDCAGHTISGSASGTGVLLDSKVDVTVTNCTVRNFTTGIGLRAASKNKILMNTIVSNTTGVVVQKVSTGFEPRWNTIHGNDVEQNSAYGVALYDADLNTVDSNSLRNNSQYALWVSGACNNTVTNNDSGPGFPLQYWHDIANAGTLAPGTSGEAVLCNVHNGVLENLRMDNGLTKNDGIVLLNSSGIQVRNNILTRTNGIYGYNISGITLSGNRITASRGNAVELDLCASCQVLTNTLENNVSGTALYLSNSSNPMQVISNTIKSNQQGIRFDNVLSPTVMSNTIQLNTTDGVALYETHGMAFNWNNVRLNNSGVTFDMHSSGASLQNNDLCYNKTWDIYNESQNQSGANNTCINAFYWWDAGAGADPGCKTKCLGWYQYKYGYQFHNPSASYLSFGCPYNGCQGDYVDTFGADQVYHSVDVCIGIPLCFPFVGCTCLGYEAKIPTPIPDPHALIYYTAAYWWSGRPGECTGMSTTSLRFQHGDKHFTDYASGATKASDLTRSGNLENAIDATHGAIVSDEIAKAFLKWYVVGGNSPGDVLNDVKQSVQNNDLGSLGMFSGGSAHTVVATDVRDDGNTARIYIYDSNVPKYSTQFPNSEDELPHIVITKTTDTWSYSGQPDMYGLWFLPYSKANGQHTIPLKYGGDIFANWGSADSQVQDQAGRRLGWENGVLVAEIPDAGVMPDWGGPGLVTETHRNYMLPRGDYTATFSGTGSGVYNASVFAGNSMLVLSDVPATPSTHDRMAIHHENDTPPTGGFSFEPSESKSFTATVGEKFDASGSTRLYTVKNANASAGGKAVLSVSPDFNSLSFSNHGPNPTSCTIEFQSTMNHDQAGFQLGFPTATKAGVVIPPMTTAVFSPTDWNNLNGSSVAVTLQQCGDNVCSVGENAQTCPEDCHAPACVAPTDDLHITASTTLCPGSYALPDSGAAGVISIDADNLMLNCQGAQLAGTGSGTGILANNRSNVTIAGCFLQNYATGIALQNAASAQVTHSVLISNTVRGIQASGSSNTHITQNYLTANQTGIDVSGATGAQVAGNLACANSSLDIVGTASTGSSGTGNRCDNTSGWNDSGGSNCTYQCTVTNLPATRPVYLPLITKH